MGRSSSRSPAGCSRFLSPCVLPLVPGYLSLMSGVSVTQLATAGRSDSRRLPQSTLLFADFTASSRFSAPGKRHRPNAPPQPLTLEGAGKVRPEDRSR